MTRTAKCEVCAQGWGSACMVCGAYVCSLCWSKRCDDQPWYMCRIDTCGALKCMQAHSAAQVLQGWSWQ